MVASAQSCCRSSCPSLGRRQFGAGVCPGPLARQELQDLVRVGSFKFGGQPEQKMISNQPRPDELQVGVLAELGRFEVWACPGFMYDATVASTAEWAPDSTFAKALKALSC